jgi:hypothetical protein
MADMKVMTDAAGYYPDVMVVRGPQAPDERVQITCPNTSFVVSDLYVAF